MSAGAASRSDDGRHSLWSCCLEDKTVERRHPSGRGDPRPRGLPSFVQCDTTVIVASVLGGAREPQSGFPDGEGRGDGAAVGLQYLLSGQVLLSFVEQIIEHAKEEVFEVFWCFQQFALCGAEARRGVGLVAPFSCGTNCLSFMCSCLPTR